MPLRRPTLGECLLLALLLHALVVLVFGSAPGGSAKPGEGVYGTLNIRLSGRADNGPETAATPPSPAAYTGPRGLAEERRWGGAVRDSNKSLQRGSEPGAARLGTWNPVTTPQVADPLPPTSAVLGASPPELQQVPPLPSVSQPLAPVAPAETLPELAPLPPVTRKLPAAAAQPLPIEHPLNREAPVEAVVAPAPTMPALAPAPSPVRNLPAAAQQPLPIEHPLNREAPVEAVVAPAPTMPALAPAPSPVRNLPAAAQQPLPIERPLNREAPVEAVVAPAPTMPALAPAPSPVRNLPGAAQQPLPIERPLNGVAPVENLALPNAAHAVPTLDPAPAPLRSLASTPAAQPLPVERPALNRVAPVDPVSLPSAPPASPALQGLPEAAPRPRGEMPPGATTNKLPPAATAASPAASPNAMPSAGEPAASGSTPRSALGAPDAGAVVGHDVATAPSSPASAARLNLDLARPRGGEISRQGSRGVLSLLPHPPESKLANDIEKSAKPDCRTAYSGMGLLAAAPLALDAIRKDGCRW